MILIYHFVFLFSLSPASSLKGFTVPFSKSNKLQRVLPLPFSWCSPTHTNDKTGQKVECRNSHLCDFLIFCFRHVHQLSTLIISVPLKMYFEPSSKCLWYIYSGLHTRHSSLDHQHYFCSTEAFIQRMKVGGK